MKFVLLNFLLVVLCVNGVFTLGIHSASSFFLKYPPYLKVSAAQQTSDISKLEAAITLECTNIPKIVAQRTFNHLIERFTAE